MSDEIDPSIYVHPPVLDVANAVGLASALLRATPRPAPTLVHKAALTLRKRTLALQQAWGEAIDATPATDRRPADVAVDNAWAALYGRLTSYAALPAHHYPDAETAAELLATLFPDGLTFLKLAYNAEWAESKKRLDHIAAKQLAGDLDRVAGAAFRAEIERTHGEYSMVLGMTAARGAAQKAPNLADPLRAVGKAISRYALAVLANAGDDKRDVAAVHAALRPIDEQRAGAARGRHGEEAAPTPTTPLPDVPVPPA